MAQFAKLYLNQFEGLGDDNPDASDDALQEKWTIELRRGNPTVFKEDRRNAISSTVTHGLLIIPYALFTNFKRLGNLFFLAISLIMIIDPTLSAYFRWITAFPLFIFTVVHVVKVLVIAHMRRKEDQRVNMFHTRRANPKGELEENVKWMDLKPGDIIYLKREEICPADIILLDTNLPKNRDMICWLCTEAIDGYSDFTMKKASNATKVDKASMRKGNYAEYRKLLSGKIEYDPPAIHHKKFSGYIKLKKDPRAEQLSEENFVPRGSVIKNTDWIYGLCVYTGNDTRIMNSSRRPINKGNYFDKLAEKFVALIIFLVLLLSAICMIILVTNKDELLQSIEYPNGVKGKLYLRNVVLQSPLLPIAFYAIFDFILAIRTFKMQRKFNRVQDPHIKESNHPQVRIMDQSAIPNLGHVDYCLIDKTGTLTTANYKIKGLFTTSKFYKLDLNVLKERVKIFRPENPTLHTLDNDNKAPITLHEIGEEGRHLELSSPTKEYRFKSDVENKLRSGTLQRYGTEKIHSNINSVVSDQLLNRRIKTEEEESPHSPPLENQKLLENKDTINLETQESGMKSMMQKKSPYFIEMSIKTKEKKTSIDAIGKTEEEINLLTQNNKSDVSPTSFFPLTAKTTSLTNDKHLMDKKYDEMEFLNDCYNSEHEIFQHFTRSLALCHTARSKYTDERYVYESAHPEDLPLLELGALSGETFIVSNRPDNPTKYTIKEKEKTKDFKILGVNDFTYNRKRFSIVTRQDDESPAFIYAKGTAMSMKSTLQLEDYEASIYDSLVNKLQAKGYKVIVIAHRELPSEEASTFMKKYQSYKMSLYSQNDELEALAKEVETGLRLVGIIALEDELRPNAGKLIQKLREADITTWMVTGDNQENAINVSYLTRLVSKETEIFNFKFDNIENGRAMIRNTLNNIRKKYQEGLAEESPTKISTVFKTMYHKKVEFCVTIDGESLSLVFGDPYLKANFTFICSLASSVIAFKLSPQNKKGLVSMIKNGFQGSPTVMAIGDGHNDKLMLQKADISLEIRTNKEILPINSGDIQVSNLDIIPELLFVEGRNISDKTEKTMLLMLYKSLVIGVAIFLFNLSSESTQNSLFDSMFIFLYSFLFTFFPIVIYGAYDKAEPLEILLAFPAFYLDGKIKKQRAWLNFLIQSFLEGVIHGVLIYEIVGYGIRATISKEGYISDFQMISLAQYYALVVIVNVKLYGYFKTNKGIWFVSSVLSLLGLLIYMFINSGAQFVISDYLRHTQAIFERAGSILSMIFVIVFCGAFSYLLKYILAQKIFQSWYSWYGEQHTFEEVVSIKNAKILASAIKPIDLGALAKAAYKQTELMDPVVQQMLHPADESLNDLGIKAWTLRFVDVRMEKQYKMIMSKLALKKFRIIYFILLLIFGGYILGMSILNEESGYTYSRVGVFIAFVVLGATLFTSIYKNHYFEITLLYIALVITIKIVFDWTRTNDSSLAATIMPAAVSLVFNAYAFWIFLLNITYYIVYFIRLIVLFTTSTEVEGLVQTKLITFYSLWSLTLLIGAVTLMISILIYKFEKQHRSEYLANTKVNLQLTKSNDILSILLPKFIKEKISSLGNDKSLAEDQGEVTILFCDIMDFDKIIQSEGKNLVQILDRIFRAFDQLCGTHGVQKIETVGKTYMACAGLKSCEIGIAKEILSVHPTRRILNLALDMDEFVKKVTYGNGIAMKLRIGVHYGRVIAGVIGYHKPQFSLIGDAVNTTSRVCTSKNNGQIRMSDEAYGKMMEAGGPGRSELYFIPKLEEMKGKGDVKVHIVARKTSNTGFKKIISNAMKINKDKNVFSVQDRTMTNSQDIRRLQTNNNDMFNNIKVNILAQKEKIKEQIEKEQKKENNNSDLDDRKVDVGLDDDDSDREDQDVDQDVVALRANPFTLKVSSPNVRIISGFEETLIQHEKTFSIRSTVGLIIIHIIQTSLMIAVNQQEKSFDNSTVLVVLRYIFPGILLLLLAFNDTLLKYKVKGPIMAVVYLYGTIITILHAAWSLNTVYQIIQILELMFINSVAIFAGSLNFMHALILTISMTIAFFTALGVSETLEMRNIFFYWLFTIINLIQKYAHFLDEVKFYNNLRAREGKKIKQSSLVGQLLPLHAAEIYFSDPTGRVDVSDQFDDVTILYADIKGFTDYSAGVEPKDVVTMLSALFTKFDKVCVKYSLYKVYTIGDCYVALSFFDAGRRNPGKEANNMVQMALAMIGIIREVRREVNFDGLDMRIGLHTGTIIGGIVGTDIVRYDIWGRDVLIANAMESEGEKGNINVSYTTRQILEANYPGVYRFESHKVVEMEKIQAKVPCFLLYSNDGVYEEEANS